MDAVDELRNEAVVIETIKYDMTARGTKRWRGTIRPEPGVSFHCAIWDEMRKAFEQAGYGISDTPGVNRLDATVILQKRDDIPEKWEPVYVMGRDGEWIPTRQPKQQILLDMPVMRREFD